MIAARVLPREEWPRLGEQVAAFCGSVSPEDVAPVVVEEDGEIVAHLAVVRAPFLESLWVAPEKVGNAGVSRMLMQAAFAKAAEWAPHWAMAHAGNSEMAATIERIGGEWLKVQTFLFRLKEEVCRLQ